MPHYVSDISAWEDWQRDYRYGVILILPPKGLSEPINKLRAKYDPQSAAICPAHISVSDPLKGELTNEVREDIKGLLRDVKPFELSFGKPQASPNRPGVAYPILSQGPIDALKNSIHQLAIFGATAYQRRHIPAHMTIAEFITIEEGLKIAEELHDVAPSGSFLCNRLELMIPDEQFRFQRVETFYFGK